MNARLFLAAGMLALSLGTAQAGEIPHADDATIAAKSAEIEMLRARLGATPSPSASATLIEAEELLRRLRQAPAGKRDAPAAQLERL